MKLDFATYAEDTGDNSRQPSRRFTVTAALGWGAPPPAPLVKSVVVDKDTSKPTPEHKKEESLEPSAETKKTIEPSKKTNER